MEDKNISNSAMAGGAGAGAPLSVYVFNEAGKHTAYCPSLDLSTSADSFNEAVSQFYEMFQLYIESCAEMGTLKEDVQAHGLTVCKLGLSFRIA